MQRKHEPPQAVMVNPPEDLEDAHAMRACLGIGPSDPLPRMVSEVTLALFFGRGVESLQRDRWRKSGYPFEKQGQLVRYDWRKCARLQREGLIRFD